MRDPSIVGRLAPSPTGLLHVGHARTFLLAWLHLRSRGGTVLLRMEDLDAERAKPGLDREILRDLEWLGLDWDGEVDLQSRSVDAHREAIDRLTSRGLVYPCVCTRAEIRSAQSAPHAGDPVQRYPGTCRDRFDSVEDARERSVREPALRFISPSTPVAISDRFAATYRETVKRVHGDFLIAKKDGAAAYQLSVVVDDARQGVTEVHRGDDLLSSTPRQWLLQEALELPHPNWIHLPLVLDRSRRRLAKRHDDLSLAELREAGLPANRLIALLAKSAGLDAREEMAAHELLASFDLARVPRDAVVLDREDFLA